ncbi:uncharacterized protein LOC116194727 [Punica granatum]|uniref:OVATE domain-containing protein n=2 Tax=Punica granatum TaxID=22663 RepID=A0A218XY12_PUNGR|nr:uncharacterized protein LOC116194727 [Punica granatum]OWM89903.1 hypothetical protein CDL15_Pgr012540 [Punica granatum]PKI60287.1 hypothetical protein CRG98_019342 [Punica granatum]
MILRSTKKFFQKTFESVKSFLSGPNYQKLPKDTATPSPFAYPCGNYGNACSQPSHGDLDNFYADFSNRWDSEKLKKRRGKRKIESSLDVKKQEKKEVPSKNNTVIPRMESRREDHHPKMGNLDARFGARRDLVQNSKSGREERNSLVAKKLKELEMIDVSNIEHVLDIEEVLHYYSLLTCPTYLDIVEKFFMELYAEFFGSPALSSSHNSKSGQQTVRGHA